MDELRFWKYHGTGNDFVLLEDVEGRFELGDFERPHGAPDVPRLDPRGRGGVGRGEAFVEAYCPDHRGLGLQIPAGVRVGPGEAEVVHHRPLV